MVLPLFSLLLISTLSYSEIRQCTPGVAAESLSDIESIAEYIDKENTDSPFQFACQKAGTNLTEPKSVWWHDNLPRHDTNGLKAQEFFNAILDRVDLLNEQNDLVAKNLQYCMGSGLELDDCKAFDNWRTGPLTESSKDARYHLGLAQEDSSLASSVGRASFSANTKLFSNSTYKEVQWEPLSKEEANSARTTLRAYVDEIKNDLKSNKWTCSTPDNKRSDRDCLHEELQLLRKSHLEQYQDIMAKVPLLQFIQSDSPTQEELKYAATQVRTYLANEKERIRNLKNIIDHSEQPTKNPELIGALPQELGDLFRYNHIVEGFLIKNPEYCGIASALKKKVEINDLKKDAGLIVPVIAISIFASPLAGAVAGVAGAGLFAKDRLATIDLERDITLSEVVGEKGKNATELRSLQLEMETEITLLPIELIGLGATKRAAQAARLLRSRK